MVAFRRATRDPWWDDGAGARRARTRRRVLTMTALGASIVACGLTAAMWIQELAPAATALLG